MIKYFIYIMLYLYIVKSELDFGEFDLRVTHYGYCKGPKRKTCANSTQAIINNTTMRFNSQVKEAINTSNLTTKITGKLNNLELLRLNWANACENIFMRPLLKSLYHMTDDCRIPKATYRFTVELQSLARNFYGGKFMYGNWTSKVLMYTNDCNMHCGIAHLVLSPTKN